LIFVMMSKSPVDPEGGRHRQRLARRCGNHIGENSRLITFV
jgi:hypothetical protein